jgi:iron complex outermembrane receptor protein
MKPRSSPSFTGVGLAALLLGALLSAGAARADDAPTPARPPVGEETLFGEIPRVISASRYEQGVNEAPASITVVSAEEIHRFGYRTLADVLRNTRGFFVSYDRNYESVGTRGFGRPGDYSNKVLVMIDGHTHTTRWLGSSLIGNDFGLDLDLVDRIEIVRGPASALYGSSAVFAVINVITRKAADLQGVGLQLRGGSFGGTGAGLHLGRTLGAKKDLVLGISGFGSSGQDLFYEEFDSPATNFGRAEGVDGEIFGDLFGRLRFGGWTFEGMGNRRRKEIPTASFNTLFDEPGTYTSDGRASGELRHEGIGASGAETSFRIYYDRSAYYADYVYDAPPITVNRDEGGSEWAGVEYRISQRAGRRQRLVAGAQYEYNVRVYQHNYDEGDPTTEYLDQSFRYFNYSAYAQDEINLGPRLLLNLGLRHDSYQTFGRSTNPRAAFIFSPSRTTTLKALYGSAFRVPTVYEAYYSDGGISVKPNPSLRPEEIRTTELVWEQGLGRRANLVASVFTYRIDDLIDQVLDPADLLVQYRNVSSVSSRGVEVEVSGKMARGVLLRGAYTNQRTTDDGTGLRLTNSPVHTMLGSAAFPLFGDRAHLALQGRYLSPRFTLKGLETRHEAVLDLTFTSSELWPWLDLTLGLRNLLDQEYADPAGNEHMQDVIPQDGRTWFVTLRHRF